MYTTPALPRHALPCLGLTLSIADRYQAKTVFLADSWSFMGLASRCVVIPRYFCPFPCPSSAHRDYRNLLCRPKATFGVPQDHHPARISTAVARRLPGGELLRALDEQGPCGAAIDSLRPAPNQRWSGFCYKLISPVFPINRPNSLDRKPVM